MQESEFFKQLKAAQPFFVMAGPNVIQSEEHVLKLACQIKAVTDKLGLLLVFKSSFDKANRTSATSFRGPGLEEGLRSADTRTTSLRDPAVASLVRALIKTCGALEPWERCAHGRQCAEVVSQGCMVWTYHEDWKAVASTQAASI